MDSEKYTNLIKLNSKELQELLRIETLKGDKDFDVELVEKLTDLIFEKTDGFNESLGACDVEKSYRKLESTIYKARKHRHIKRSSILAASLTAIFILTFSVNAVFGLNMLTNISKWGKNLFTIDGGESVPNFDDMNVNTKYDSYMSAIVDIGERYEMNFNFLKISSLPDKFFHDTTVAELSSKKAIISSLFKTNVDFRLELNVFICLDGEVSVPYKIDENTTNAYTANNIKYYLFQSGNKNIAVYLDGNIYYEVSSESLDELKGFLNCLDK